MSVINPYFDFNLKRFEGLPLSSQRYSWMIKEVYINYMTDSGHLLHRVTIKKRSINIAIYENYSHYYITRMCALNVERISLSKYSNIPMLIKVVWTENT